MFCATCNAPLPADANYCPKCGRLVQVAQPVQKRGMPKWIIILIIVGVYLRGPYWKIYLPGSPRPEMPKVFLAAGEQNPEGGQFFSGDRARLCHDLSSFRR